MNRLPSLFRLAARAAMRAVRLPAGHRFALYRAALLYLDHHHEGARIEACLPRRPGWRLHLAASIVAATIRRPALTLAGVALAGPVAALYLARFAGGL